MNKNSFSNTPWSRQEFLTFSSQLSFRCQGPLEVCPCSAPGLAPGSAPMVLHKHPHGLCSCQLGASLRNAGLFVLKTLNCPWSLQKPDVADLLQTHVPDASSQTPVSSGSLSENALHSFLDKTDHI